MMARVIPDEVVETPGAVRWNAGRLEQQWTITHMLRGIVLGTVSEWRPVPEVAAEKAGAS